MTVREIFSGALLRSASGRRTEIFLTELYAGRTETLYLYYSISGTAGEVNIGAAINVATSKPGIIQLTDGGAYNYSIEIAGNPVLRRWMHPEESEVEVAYRPAQSVEDEIIIGIAACGPLKSNEMVENYTQLSP